MVLSFGALGDIEDELAGDDSTALVTQRTPESTVPLAMIGPTTSVPTGSLSSSGGGWTDFLKGLGIALGGTAANYTATALTRKSPAEMAKLQAQQQAAAAAQRNQLLVIGGVVLGVIVVGGLLLRRRAA
jgi:hypothetical protein